MTNAHEPPVTERLTFERFGAADAEGLAVLMGDPEIARNIIANGATPERRAATARARIARHNSAWEAEGYGVWALKARGHGIAPPGTLLGWCGFTEPDLEGEDPETLYGLARACWGQGLASEAARAALAWFFEATDYPGVAATISARLNPGSARVVRKLGMTQRGTMAFSDFLPDPDLARDVLDYEIWRLGEGPSDDPEALLEQAPFRAGQIVATGCAAPEEVEQALLAAALGRQDLAQRAGLNSAGALEHQVREAFREGRAQAWMDRYHLSRDSWGASEA